MATDFSIKNVLSLLQKWDQEIGLFFEGLPVVSGNREFFEKSQNFVPKFTQFPLKKFCIPSGYHLNYRLGSGKTSDVYCVSPESDLKTFLVLKFPKEPKYQEIVNCEAQLMFDMADNNNLFQNPYLAKIETTISVQSKGLGSLTGFISYPCGIDKTDGKLSLVAEDIRDLVVALQALHKADFLHRDITPENVGHYWNKNARKVFLRDFGFSISSVDAGNPYEGAMITASKNVLESLQANTPYSFTPRDDFESLAKTVIIVTSGCSPLVPLSAVTSKEKASALLAFWRRYDEHIQHVVDCLVVGESHLMSWCVMFLPFGDSLSPVGTSEKKIPSPTRLPPDNHTQRRSSKKKPHKESRSESMGDLSDFPLPQQNLRVMQEQASSSSSSSSSSHSYFFRPR